jgi:hypothetical protein
MQPTTAEIACRALGLQPAGQVWEGSEPLHCAMEGRPLQSGERIAPFKPGANFMDDAALADRSPVVSGWVAPLLGRNTMSKVQRAVITEEGIFPTSKKIHRAFFLMNPPEPPFAWVISDATMQHLIWKAPLNLSNQQFRIQLGNRVLLIRRRCLDEAVERGRQSEIRPWLDTDWAIKSPNFGRINPKLDADFARFLTTLTTGETWAAGIILSATREGVKELPVKPDPIILD